MAMRHIDCDCIARPKSQDSGKLMKRKKLIALAVALAIAAPLSAFVDSVTTNEEALIAAMNRERAAYGLKPLRLNLQLALAAEDRVHDMFAQHYFNHVAPDGTQPFVWADRRGYDYKTIGENLATGYRTPAAVVDGWMHSPAHRANILGRDFDEVGIAVAGGSPVRGYSGPLYVAIYGAR
jgi:uncharacterized protein YkwD